jgi:gamma-glutamyltranspeptidase/glutathione hydrolase
MYRGYEVLSPPPSSSGGICLSELLNVVEGYNLSAMGYHSSKTVHVMTEAMKRVYADRAEYLGDPDFVDIPTEKLISKDYAARHRAGIDTSLATPAVQVRAGLKAKEVQQHTTHYVVADRFGNVVSTTYTINDLFGNKVIVKGAGFFLNDEMDDFVAKPGVPNAYGLLGGDANAIEPQKRPLSSMTPTIVVKDGKPVMALGARGGSKIITTIFQTILNVIDFGMNVHQAVDAPRFHHQWLPDELLLEEYCLPNDVIENLKKMGHTIKEVDYYLAAIEALWFDAETGFYYGVPDAREGGVALGY